MSKPFIHSRTMQKQLKALGPSWLWLCLLLGGASQGGMLANLFLQLGAAALIAVWIWRGIGPQLANEERVPVYLFAVAMLWIAIMFIPLPPFLWQIVPGRDLVAEGYQLLDMELPWLALALTPDRALRSLSALFAPFAAWYIARRLDLSDARRLVAGIAIIAAGSAALGLMQMSTGPDSILRLYSPTNRDSPVGLFANTNHFSVFLACSLPLAAAWIATVKPQRKPARNLVIGLGIYVGLIALALIVGRSLAGFAFMILGLIAVTHILWGRFAGGRPKTVVLAAVTVAALIAFAALGAIGSGAIGAKFEDVPNSRANITPVTLAAGTEMAPTGSGLGSFVQVYAMHQPDRYTSTTWVNHAHNDYAEIYLELGIPGVLIVLAFLVWFAMQGIRIWRQNSDATMLIPKAAWLSAAMLLLHSLVDYPLRTAALAALFASAIGLLCSPVIIRKTNISAL
jgi:O-antigen ligase